LSRLPLRLDRRDVHLWSLRLGPLECDLDTLSETLHPDEIARAGRFRFERDRRSYVAARGLIRTILGLYVNVPPAHVAFAYGPHGKPGLIPANSASDVSFNLSHSNELALLALTRGRPVGVDLERIRPFEDVADVPGHIFSQRELAEFQDIPALDRAPAFFNAWTRKEALVKATGLGFSSDVTEVEVTFVPGMDARLVSLCGDPKIAAKWTIRDLAAPHGYAAALAVSGGIRDVLVVSSGNAGPGRYLQELWIDR
jgi:4'-phosphopantetheinyl transferase